MKRAVRVVGGMGEKMGGGRSGEGGRRKDGGGGKGKDGGGGATKHEVADDGKADAGENPHGDDVTEHHRHEVG